MLSKPAKNRKFNAIIFFENLGSVFEFAFSIDRFVRKVLIRLFRNLVSPLVSKTGDKCYVDLCRKS